MTNNSVKVIPLGGLGEIGKNITAIEYKDEIIVIDCGVSFPDEEMYGVDLVIPDITYLLDNKDKVKGFFLTHGHEDHIGSLPYILKQLNLPIYGTKLTLGIVQNKLKEHDILSKCELNGIKAGDVIKVGDLEVEFIRVTHSIADSCAIAIHTPIGVILHTGDFKIDYTPIDGSIIDFQRISELGKQGVMLLMADSTNVQRPGHTISEKAIGDTLTRIFSNAEGRVIVATFASNIHRMQQIVNASVKYGRKVAFSGRSMENISQVAIELGYLNIPEGELISVDDINNYSNDKITIITTGSQGEPMAALARIAFANHRKISIEPKDLFIISASPIPGNEKLISKVINQLFKKGASVIYEDLEEVHVSGHAYEEELKLIHTLVHPKFFMPVHGEYRHLKHHGKLARKLGMEESNIFILETGQILELWGKEAKISGRVHTGAVFVDGLGVGDVGNIVLRDRKHLAQDGIITIVVTIEKESYKAIAGPDIITRGFVYAKESEELINESKEIVKRELENCLDNRIIEWYVLKSSIKKSLEKYLYEQTKRRPIVLPIIMEI
ncbi:beta-CASP RNase J family ribonuclease [Clostridium tetanomorphum]|uniref:ribonuclease J n=1 Tax=Clostridium tetanomorphum TaxID=1553 RepID=UPI00044CB0B2|nr:ribonuclease J [Clostridium tetanomorphum]KAJ51272.1 RNA-metabolising metallo-beta-lactamase [Clostridium tetanomorphum DSM 665]MBP1864828.1 beta-CASP RNase J family ribonuclease [Clostridium tetanomorphum]NRS84004.1 beta-CASP RNase J family ribonuclease [Clostridium tetanomorphum]SQB92933.1 RNA-metabolising metallo-beta-lactamase [Clostridium tetanomorphum]